MQITPYIEFNGNCEEAMNFYKNIFGGELTIKTYEESPEDISDVMRNKVMNAHLTFNEIEIMASDIINESEVIPETSITLALEYDDLEEAENIFNKLSEESTSNLSFKYSFWGTKFVTFKDKFGIKWMITL